MNWLRIWHFLYKHNWNTYSHNFYSGSTEGAIATIGWKDCACGHSKLIFIYGYEPRKDNGSTGNLKR